MNVTDIPLYPRTRPTTYHLIPPLAATALVLLIGQWNMLASHALGGIVETVGAGLIAAVGWEIGEFTVDGFSVYLAIGYFWVAIFNIAYTFAFFGVFRFAVEAHVAALDFRLGGDLLESLLLLSCPFVLQRRIWHAGVFVAFALYASLLIGSIAGDHRILSALPTHWLDLTTLFIIVTLVAAGANLVIQRRIIDYNMRPSLAIAIAAELLSLLTHTGHIHLTALGPAFKLLSYWFVYRALVGIGLLKPMSLLERQARTYDSIPDLIVVTDTEATIRYANASARSHVTATKENIDGRHCHPLFHAGTTPASDCPICRSIATGMKPSVARHRVIRGGHHYDVTLSPLRVGRSDIGLVQVMRDVTEQVATSEERERMALQLDAVFCISRNHIAYMDSSFRLLRVNPSYAAAIGLDARELIGRTHFELFPDRNKERVFRHVVTTGNTASREADIIVNPHLPWRGRRCFDWSLHPIKDVHGNVVELVLSMEDVTERELAIETIRKSEDKYRTLMEHAGDGVILTDRELRVVDTNYRLTEMMSRNRATFMDCAIHDLFIPADEERLDSLLATALCGKVATQELSLLRTASSPLPVEISGAAIEHDNEKTMLFSVRDISTRKAAEEALQRSEARSRAIIRHAGVGIRICSIDGRLLESNMALQEFLGYSHDELSNADWSSIALRDCCDADEFAPFFLWEGGVDPYRTQRGYRRKDGLTAWAECVTSVVHDEAGHPLLGIEMVPDSTEKHAIDETRIRHEQELSAAKRSAERASAAKSRFLAAASHDLRQPVQAIHLLVHLLQLRQLDAEAAEIVARVRNSIEGLGSMLDTLLDISKLDAGLVVPRISAFPVEPLLRQLINEFAPMAQSRGLQLKAVGSSALVRSDRTLLTRILRNILANAVRYTPSGRILVGCRRRDGMLAIAVIDTGIGIAESDIKDIFQEFHQVANQARDRREGLGLGLAIVERLVHLLGHTVSVSSQPGSGTTFTVSLPVSLSEDDAASPASQLTLAMDVPHGVIAVVEDETDIREGLVMVLTYWGYRVFSGSTGDEILSALGGDEEIPELVIADYRLSDETGVDVIRKIRARLRRKLPGILLTGDTDPERLSEANLWGLTLLNKPLQPEQLRNHVAQVLNASRRAHSRR